MQLKPSMDVLDLDSAVDAAAFLEKPKDVTAVDMSPLLGGEKDGKQMLHVRSASVNVESSTIHHSTHQKIDKDRGMPFEVLGESKWN